MESKPYRYSAFLSYSHSADSAFAPTLQRALQTFAKPWYHARAIRVFRDTTNLSADPDLWASIETALAESEYFLLLASPLASRSKWVQKELEYWRQNRDPSKLILVLTEGTLTWAVADRDFDWSTTDAVPRSLPGAFPAEPFFIDFRAFKDEKLSTRHPDFLDRIATLAATLRGQDKDAIAGEHVRQHRRTVRTALAAAATLCVLAVVATIFGVVSRERGKRIDAQNVRLRQSFVASELSLGTALIREGRMAEGLWHYWLAYENTTPGDTARQSALNLIGTWSQLAGRPLVNDSALRHVMFGRDGKSVLTVTDRAAQLWDIQTGEPLAEKVAASDAPWQAMAVSPDAETLIVASGAAAAVWDIRAGQRRGEPLAHGDTISNVAISADGTTILTQSSRLIRFWNARAGTAYGQDVKAGASPYAVLTPDGRSVFLGFDEPRLSNLSSGESTTVPFWPHHDRGNRMAMFSPDGSILIAAGNTDEDVRDYEHAEVWKVGSDKLIPAAMSHRGSFTTVTFSSDSRHVLTGGDDNTANLWLWSGDQLRRQGPPLPHGGSVVSAAFAHDRARAARMVLTGSTDKIARLWRFYDLTTTVQTSYLLRHGGSVDSVAISADGRTVLTGSSDGIARLWNPYLRAREPDSESRKAETPVGVDPSTLESREMDAVVTLEPSATLMAISPDRTVAAFRGDDNTVRLWLVSTRERIGAPLTHEDAVNSVEFSPDGRTLLTASGDTKARFWDVASGALLGDPLLHSYKVQSAHYTPDGRRVITRASGPYLSDDGYWNAPRPAVDQPECLKLSIEWRTGYRIDSSQRLSRLTQSEWLTSKRKLDTLGGPCDVGSWEAPTK